MKNIDLKIKVSKPFGNLIRKKSTLIVVEANREVFLVGAKPQQYPPTITRLLGGGVDDGEPENLAVKRELYEELGVQLDESQITGLFIVKVRAEDDEGNSYNPEVHVYYADIGSASYRPGDDVKEIVKLTLDGLYKLGEAYEALPETLWYNGPEGVYSWRDYAKLYGPVHKLCAEAVKALKAK